MNRSTVFLIYTASFFVSVLVGVQAWTFVLTLWEPFYYDSIVSLTPKVKRGENFVERLDVTRYRICRVEIDRFLVDDTTHNVIFRERVPGGATALGRSTALNMVPVPQDAPLGMVTLLQNVHSHCIDGMHSGQWPIMHFEIVE